MTSKGIDLSRWNNVLSFKDVKNDGFDFVILRAGGNNGGYYKDSKFDWYYNEAKKAGLKVGAYYDTGKDFINTIVGNAAAYHFLNLLQGKQFEMPVYADVETVATIYKQGATDAFIAFASVLENAKYYAGIYGSDISGFKDRLNLKQIEGRFTIWCARYGAKPSYVKKYDIWQKQSNGVVAGIEGPVDIDICTKNFTTAIKKKGLNGF